MRTDGRSPGISARALLLIGLLALALRAGWVFYRWSADGAALRWDDEQLHWQLASNLVQRGELVSEDGRHAARMPLYPFFLALFAPLGDLGVLAARFAQALVGASTCVVMARWAGAALGERAGVMAGLLGALDPFAVFFANLLLNESLFMLASVLFCWSAWWLTRTCRVGEPATPQSGRLYASFWLAGAACVLIRPEAIFFVPIAWLVVLGLCRLQRTAVLNVAAAALALAIGLGAWAARNAFVLGTPVVLSTNGGVTLFDGQGPQASGGSDQSFLRRMPELLGLNEAARDLMLRDEAARQMQEDPWRVLRLAGVKFLRTWNPVPNVEEYRRGYAAAIGAAFTVLVLIAAVIGIARHWRERLIWIWTLSPVLIYTAICCIFVGSVRYRVPLMPFVEIMAAAAFASRYWPGSIPRSRSVNSE